MFANFIRLTERDIRGYLEDMSYMDMEELKTQKAFKLIHQTSTLKFVIATLILFLFKTYKMYYRIYFQVDEVKINKEVDSTNIEMAVFVAVNGLSL